jgi:hypothetical protein
MPEQTPLKEGNNAFSKDPKSVGMEALQNGVCLKGEEFRNGKSAWILNGPS